MDKTVINAIQILVPSVKVEFVRYYQISGVSTIIINVISAR